MKKILLGLGALMSMVLICITTVIGFFITQSAPGGYLNPMQPKNAHLLWEFLKVTY